MRALCAAVVLSPCAAALAQDTAKVRTEVEGRLARHASAVAAQDVATALDLYAEDAVVRPANMDPVRGKAQLREFFRQWFAAATVKDASYATEEFEVFGEKALHIGSYRGTAVLPGVSPVVDRGSFTIVWTRQADGTWRYHRGIFNSSLPPDQTMTRKK
jgi:uncharacterized protein (TIGR02246 family)